MSKPLLFPNTHVLAQVQKPDTQIVAEFHVQNVLRQHMEILFQHKLHKECEGQWNTPAVQCLDWQAQG